MAAITIAGENLIAEKQAALEVLVVSKFLYALVPGLDPATPVDRYAGKPPPDQMMYETEITKGGYVDPNQVVYSSMIGSNIGDWDFNWLGLETAEGVLLAAAYTPVQQKRKNIPNQQIGNNITRNMMLVFDGAQSVTELTISADTWQADFTVRMAGMDERERLSNRDMYGRACYFGDSLALVHQNEQFTIQPGIAYVEGLAVNQPSGAFITPPVFPFTLWYDVSLQGELSGVKVVLATSFGDNLVDFVDSNGVVHYLVPVATVLSSSEITDLRSTVEPITGALIQHLAARNGDYPDLRARATTKEDVDLGNLPNAKSDDPDSNDSEILATTAALHAVKTGIETDLAALGSAAYLDAQVNLDDATADALMKVGAFGLGGLGIALPDDTNLDTVILGGLYRINTGGGVPAGMEYSAMLVIRSQDTIAQIIVSHMTGTIMSRGAWGVNEGQVPTFCAWSTGWNNTNFNPANYALLSSPDFINGINVTGDSTFWNSLVAVGNISAQGILQAAGQVFAGNGAAYLNGDGNVCGPVWGGWLSSWISTNFPGYGNLMSHLGAQGAGWVGTYALMTNRSGVVLNPGDLVDGASLTYTNTEANSRNGGAANGTWRCMGSVSSGSDDQGSTVFLRVV